MAFANWTAFLTAFTAGALRIPLVKLVAGTLTQGRPVSTWTWTPLAGVAPTTAAVPVRTTTGCILQGWPNPTGGVVTYAIGGNVGLHTATGGAQGFLIVADRLSHQGGLSGTTTGAQTTNLPTAALTRYTSGVGVWALIEIYTAIGATATTVTASYTNSAGTAGRTSIAQDIGGTGRNGASRTIMLPLQSGDDGVRSVESVTLAATTGTAGNFGVTLVKPLAILAVTGSQEASDPFISGAMAGIPAIADDACVSVLYIPGNSATATVSVSGDLILAQA